MKNFNMIFSSIVFLSISSMVCFAKAETKTINTELGECTHKMELIDGDGDGKYDLIKNYFIGGDGVCYKHTEGPIKKPETKTINTKLGEYTHKMELIDRDGDGKYDLIKNYFIGGDGVCYKHTEGPIKEIAVPKNPSFEHNAQEFCSDIENIVFYAKDYTFLDLQDTASHISPNMEVVLYTNPECDGTWFATITSNALGEYKIEKYAVFEMTDTQFLQLFLTPYGISAEGRTPEDFIITCADIITGETIDLTLGTLAAQIYYKFELFNSDGLLISTINNDSKLQSLSFSVSGLPNGTYVIRNTSTLNETDSKTILLNK